MKSPIFVMKEIKFTAVYYFCCRWRAQSMDDIEIILNKAAQGIVSISEARDWFIDSDLERRNDILRKLSFITLQAGASPADIEQSIAESGLKPTFTPCVLLRAKQLREGIGKIVLLPENEQEKSFFLLLSLFKIADIRGRETRCKGGCTHEWHNLKL